MRKHVIFSCIQFKSCVFRLISTKIDRIPTVAHFPYSRYIRDFICEVTCSKAKRALPEADTGVIEEIATTIGVDKISNHHQRRNRARKRYTKRLCKLQWSVKQRRSKRLNRSSVVVAISAAEPESGECEILQVHQNANKCQSLSQIRGENI